MYIKLLAYTGNTRYSSLSDHSRSNLNWEIWIGKFKISFSDKLYHVGCQKQSFHHICALKLWPIVHSIKMHNVKKRIFTKILQHVKWCGQTLIKSVPIISKFHSSLNYKQNDMNGKWYVDGSICFVTRKL